MHAEKLSLSFGANQIYDNAEFNILPQDKVGIVGVNGAGKTTLFKIILGQIKPDSGYIDVENKTIGYLPQQIEIKDSDITVWDFLLTARPIKALEKKQNDLYEKLSKNPEDKELLNKLSDIQEELEYYNYYGYEDELLSIIDNMDIDSSMLDMKLKDLSGGQKSKVAFARLLYSKFNILLLDEPTNHLDIKTKDYVSQYLRKYKGMVLIISHDTDFLNGIVNKILYVDKALHKISVFSGNYETYKKKLAELKHRKEKQIQSEERQIKKLSDFIEKAKQASPTNHSIKKLGHTREKQLDKILKNKTIKDKIYKKIKMNLRPLKEGPKHPISVEGLWFRYPGSKLLYRDLSFYITGKERFLIVGENGIGKSTLLKLILGKLTPEKGTITINPKTDIAYYAQELELVDESKTVIENVSSPEYTDEQLRAVLSNFLFYDMDVFKKAEVLSPGEKARVALCKLLLKRANMLILDEPTNHLDPETQKIIGDNFKDFEGTIIVVSHNPEFVEQIGITRMLVLPSGKIKEYSHELLEYYYALNTKE